MVLNKADIFKLAEPSLGFGQEGPFITRVFILLQFSRIHIQSYMLSNDKSRLTLKAISH
jgi:hypothetical protein